MLRILLLVSLSSLAFASAQTPVGEVVVGNIRVSALSPTLVRVEPKGPTGFEDRTTFMVVSRAFDKIPIKVLKQAAFGKVSANDLRAAVCQRGKIINGTRGGDDDDDDDDDDDADGLGVCPEDVDWHRVNTHDDGWSSTEETVEDQDQEL